MPNAHARVSDSPSQGGSHLINSRAESCQPFLVAPPCGFSTKLPLPRGPLTIGPGGQQAAKLASRQTTHDQDEDEAHPKSPWQRILSWTPGTEAFRTRAKLSPRSRLPVLYLASGFILLLVLLAQFFGSRDIQPPAAPVPEPTQDSLSPFGDSVYRQEAYYDLLEPGTQCKPKSLFSADLPVTHVLTNMALEAEAKRMVAQFEYPAEDVNKGVKEFIREMEEGLEKQGTPLSQIPTYVTSVPNGTEKVGSRSARLRFH